ncbi:nucleoside deaminase [Vibrio viridaestus]|uniref:Nucleoside deaminase n=1 Tax=Vibrio viridaestus TaxID=2487322 RepID=A0A3N9TG19_9VIBR|nr:nucleoside deaminase [Vibrio viridaestus]RQW63089.1 nucleoside deaminase [Vibrio viridaestus]
MSVSSKDLSLLRDTFSLAEDAKNLGIHPFAAILVNKNGEKILEQINGYLPNKDMTGHAERKIMTRASKLYSPEFLQTCTLYISAEPCAMCAGAIYWAGVGRVVYGLSEATLKQLTGNHPENPTLALPCRIVFESGQRKTEVHGPLLEDEAAQVHEGMWS